MRPISETGRQVRRDMSNGDARHARILRLPQVLDMTGVSRSTIYLSIAAGRFPPPVALGERARGWIASEIDAWLDARVAERDLAKGA